MMRSFPGSFDQPIREDTSQVLSEKELMKHNHSMQVTHSSQKEEKSASSQSRWVVHTSD